MKERSPKQPRRRKRFLRNCYEEIWLGGECERRIREQCEASAERKFLESKDGDSLRLLNELLQKDGRSEGGRITQKGVDFIRANWGGDGYTRRLEIPGIHPSFAMRRKAIRTLTKETGYSEAIVERCWKRYRADMKRIRDAEKT